MGLRLPSHASQMAPADVMTLSYVILLDMRAYFGCVSGCCVRECVRVCVLFMDCKEVLSVSV